MILLTVEHLLFRKVPIKLLEKVFLKMYDSCISGTLNSPYISHKYGSYVIKKSKKYINTVFSDPFPQSKTIYSLVHI